MKVTIVIPWFGPWPTWFGYFLQSCAWNRNFEWLLVSDAPAPSPAPVNVRFLTMPLNEFSKYISSKLKLSIRLKNPYKICDLKPAFGEIFSGQLSDAQYWGYSDLDLVYGNINTFVGSLLEQSVDIIGVRDEYLPGHFTLYRNTSENNSIFRTSPAYEKVFTDTDHHYSFTERMNIYGKRLWENDSYYCLKNLYAGNIKLWRRIRHKFRTTGHSPVRDMTNITKDLSEKGLAVMVRKTCVRSDLWYEKKQLNAWKIRCQNGCVTDTETDEEFLHFHLIRSKRKRGFSIEPWKENRCFEITPGGISIQE